MCTDFQAYICDHIVSCDWSFASSDCLGSAFNRDARVLYTQIQIKREEYLPGQTVNNFLLACQGFCLKESHDIHNHVVICWSLGLCLWEPFFKWRHHSQFPGESVEEITKLGKKRVINLSSFHTLINMYEDKYPMGTVKGPDQTSSKQCIDICLSATALIRVSNMCVIPHNTRVSMQHLHDPFWLWVIILDLIIYTIWCDWDYIGSLFFDFFTSQCTHPSGLCIVQMKKSQDACIGYCHLTYNKIIFSH